MVFGDRAGEAELVEGGDDQPGPAGELPGVTERGLVPAQGVLGEPVGVLDVKAVMTRVTAEGSVSMDRCGALISVMCAPARLAMASCSAGGQLQAGGTNAVSMVITTSRVNRVLVTSSAHSR